MSNNGTVLSARNDATDLVNFKILLNGSFINREYGIVSLTVSKSFNRISSAKIVIKDGDPAARDFKVSSDENALVPGSEIEIRMGYHNQAEPIFKGIIVKHAISSMKSRSSFLTIEAKDKAIKLALERKNHYYLDQSDSDITAAIINRSPYGGTLTMDATRLKHKEMVQYNVTDWDFILLRAEMNGLLVLTNDNKLEIKKPDIAQKAVRDITYGMDVLEFESELDASSQIQQAKSHSWNYKDQEVEEVEGSVDFKENGNVTAADLARAVGMSEYNLCHTGSLDHEELKSWSDALLLKSRMARSVGRVKIKGTTEICSGQVISLSGFSSRFNGNVLVTGVRQSYDHSSWETDIQFGLPRQWFYQRDDIIDKPASGLVPGINGLHIGVVLSNENDPDGQDRIKIKIPLIDNNDGIWARISSLDAGNERGAFFRPEISDEVVVGYLNDDPRHPVILGMLNSSNKPAPLQGKDDNHEKGFVTRSKMKMIFNDEKKSFILDTPQGKKIEVNEDADAIILSDQHNNKITMNADGISIESAGTISIKSSAGDVKVEALNIQNKANIEFSAKGNASATLQASGQTVVKGGIVSIN